MSSFTRTTSRATGGTILSIRWRHWQIAMPLLALLCLGLLIVSVTIGVGSVTLSPAQMWRAIWTPGSATKIEIVATNARFARATMALGVGAALGAAGALLQALYRNPLADPSITGVTQGATTAAIVWLTFGPALPPGQVSWALPAVAAVGALFAATTTWGVTRLSGQVEPIRLILIGVLVGGVLGAVTSITLLVAGDDAQNLIGWLSGSLAIVTWNQVRLFGIAIAITLPLMLIAIPRANVLQFGDQIAQGLGQSVAPARIIVLVASCLLTAAAVCTIGGIGFVGLVAPHMLRWLVGSDLRRLVPASMLAGGALVLICDFIARNLRPIELSAWLGIPLQPVSLPVGVYLGLLGAPFFLYLLRRTRS